MIFLVGVQMTTENAFARQIRDAVSLMKSRNVVFEDGLLDNEIDRVENQFCFRFPPDFRAFLQYELPVSGGFPNWRESDEVKLRRFFDWPFEGIAFDIEQNTFWMDEWGVKPSNVEQAVEIGRKAVEAAPILIPICGHRYLPSVPFLAGNPVLSVYQTDIIFYGCDLWDFFVNEFVPYQNQRFQRCLGMSSNEYYSVHRVIPFWTQLVQLNDGDDEMSLK